MWSEVEKLHGVSIRMETAHLDRYDPEDENINL